MRVPPTCHDRAPEIPFDKPSILGPEVAYVTQAIRTGRIGSDGAFTQRCARVLEERFGVLKALMTPSCTAALEMAAMLCEVGPGDEVIMPSYTFVSTASAFVRLGARPVFVDIRPDTLNMDESRIAEAITPRTRAIVPVHYAGVGCEMETILEVARRYGLWVVEDAAQGVNAFYRGRALGSIGHLGTYSFHATKNITCGQGGALMCNDPALIRRAEILRDKGTNRAQFFRGEVDKYTWVDVGSSYIPSEVNCAFLLAQLERMDEIKRRRSQVIQYYRERLRPIENAGLLRLPVIPAGCQSHDRMFFMILNSAAERDGLIAHLKRRGIGATFHFVPLHTSPVGARLGYREGDLPVTESLSGPAAAAPLLHRLDRGGAGACRGACHGVPPRCPASRCPGPFVSPSDGCRPGGGGPVMNPGSHDDGRAEPELSVVVPAYRSADCLEALADAVARALRPLGRPYELILVNDGSPDATWRVIEALCRSRPEVVGVDLMRNFGQDNAIMTGLRLARGAVVAIMDDDLQHDPADMPAMVARLEAGADVVYADFLVKRQHAWKNLGSWFNGKVAEWVLDKPRGVYLSPYKVMRREVLELICRYDGPDPYVDGLLFQVTSRFDRVPVEHHRRHAGRGHYNFARSVAVWSRLATGFSVRPLRVVTWCGLVLGAFGGVLAVVVIAYRLLYPGVFAAAVAGWASLIVAQLLIGGIQMIFLGVLGEYAGRMHTAVAGKKPQATVRQVLNAGRPWAPSGASPEATAGRKG